jgi:membrane protease YdiL (CAAX protease family)
MDSSPSLEPQLMPAESLRPVAETWHTVVFLCILAGFSLASARSANLTPVMSRYGRYAGYVQVMILEWLMVVFVWYGIRRRGVRLRDLVGGNWNGNWAVIRDVLIAIGFLLVSSGVLNGMSYLLKAVPNQAIRNLLPRGHTEIALYLALAATAGFCEEVIFRGYLQRQFAAGTRSATAGILLQGLAFGAGHGYQGSKYVAMIAVFGILFGLLAQWRGSLRPGMIAHALQDGVAGLLAITPALSGLR